MTDKRFHTGKIIRLVLVFGLLMQVTANAFAFSDIHLSIPTIFVPEVAQSNLLYRADITIKNEHDWQRLDEIGVTVLGKIMPIASVLVTSAQLETLARLQFKPRSINELSHLVQTYAAEEPALARSLQPLFAELAAAEAVEKCQVFKTWHFWMRHNLQVCGNYPTQMVITMA